MEIRAPLVGLPIILLPLCNLVAAWVARGTVTMSGTWILGAVAEEVFFRLFLLRLIFLRTMKPVSAVVLVSVLFAGMHLFNLRAGQTLAAVLPQMMAAFCFSIWAGAATRKSTWLIPLLAHGLLNATAGAENEWVVCVASVLVMLDGVILMKEGDDEMPALPQWGHSAWGTETVASSLRSSA